MDTQYLHRNQSQPGQHRGCQLYQPDHLQVRPVPATDLDIGYKVSATYLKLNVPSILLDIRAQTMQRLHKKTSVLQFIAVLGHDMAKIEQLGINLPRVGPEKRQKKNRKVWKITPLMVKVPVLLQPQQHVVCIETSLGKLRDNQNQKVLLIPEDSLGDRQHHVQHNTEDVTPHHPGLRQSWPRPQLMGRAEQGSCSSWSFPSPSTTASPCPSPGIHMEMSRTLSRLQVVQPVHSKTYSKFRPSSYSESNLLPSASMMSFLCWMSM